jgi:hypothetical protein
VMLAAQTARDYRNRYKRYVRYTLLAGMLTSGMAKYQVTAGSTNLMTREWTRVKPYLESRRLRCAPPRGRIDWPDSGGLNEQERTAPHLAEERSLANKI